MKGEIICVDTWEDEFKNIVYRVFVEFKKKPPFKLGEAEIEQGNGKKKK